MPEATFGAEGSDKRDQVAVATEQQGRSTGHGDGLADPSPGTGPLVRRIPLCGTVSRCRRH
ncbi:hypothetical protein ATKI12_4404 [Kitasatospora sp. Ki12]